MMIAMLLSSGVVTARAMMPQATTASSATFDAVQIVSPTAGGTTTAPSTLLAAAATPASTVVPPPKAPVLVATTAATSTPLAAAAAPANTPAPRGPGGSWHLVFGDEFNGTSIDTTKWNTCYWWAGSDNGCANGGDGSMNYYLPNEVGEGNGLVDLAAQNKMVTGSNGKTYNYVDGMIATNRMGSQTADRFSYTYGYMEIQTKLPAGWGYWPGFWLAASDHSWPPEIDAMEANGGDPHTVTLTIHWPNGTSGGGQDSSNYSDPNVDFTNSYHTFGVDWEPNAVTWYVDGVVRKTFTNSAAIPATPMDLLANLAVNGNSGWAPTSSTAFPGHMLINYIRIWQKG
jgi:beta-glucanase (GH16 family)